MPQGAPESPLVFVLVADEILGGLRPSWERRNFAWTCDAVSLSCLGYADDVLLVSGFKASLETMIEDCCTKFGEAGLEVGLDKTHWSSSITMDGETAGGARPEYCMGTEAGVYWVSDRAWCAQWWSGEASHAKGVLSLLQVETNPNLSFKERMNAFEASTLSVPRG